MYLFASMATSFGHYGHHQANIVQKFEKKIPYWVFSTERSVTGWFSLFYSRLQIVQTVSTYYPILPDLFKIITPFNATQVMEFTKTGNVRTTLHVVRSRKHHCHEHETICSLFIVVGVCGCQQYKSAQLPGKRNNTIPLQCCRATKYFVLLSTVINITHSESVSVALAIQHAMRMRRIVLSTVACRLYQILPHYLINGTIFGKTLLNLKCVCFEFLH
jgi:hypothetical protein